MATASASWTTASSSRWTTPAGLKSAIGDPDEVTLEQVFLNLTGRSLRD